MSKDTVDLDEYSDWVVYPEESASDEAKTEWFGNIVRKWKGDPGI